MTKISCAASISIKHSVGRNNFRDPITVAAQFQLNFRLKNRRWFLLTANFVALVPTKGCTCNWPNSTFQMIVCRFERHAGQGSQGSWHLHLISQVTKRMHIKSLRCLTVESWNQLLEYLYKTFCYIYKRFIKRLN